MVAGMSIFGDNILKVQGRLAVDKISGIYNASFRLSALVDYYV